MPHAQQAWYVISEQTYSLRYLNHNYDAAVINILTDYLPSCAYVPYSLGDTVTTFPFLCSCPFAKTIKCLLLASQKASEHLLRMQIKRRCSGKWGKWCESESKQADGAHSCLLPSIFPESEFTLSAAAKNPPSAALSVYTEANRTAGLHPRTAPRHNGILGHNAAPVKHSTEAFKLPPIPLTNLQRGYE